MLEMKHLELVIRHPIGLHARLAKEFVMLAKKYQSNINIYHGKKKANAKSLLAVLTMGVHSGSTIRVEVSSEDDEEAALVLEEAVLSWLGEVDRLLQAPEAADAPEPAPIAEPTAVPAAAELHVDFQGIAAAPGDAIGPVFQLLRREVVIDQTFSGAAAEEVLLQKGLQVAREQLTVLRDQMLQRSKEEADIFDVHLELLDAVNANIVNGQSAGAAKQAVSTLQEGVWKVVALNQMAPEAA
jgi:multiphosphoryl transfer protein